MTRNARGPFVYRAKFVSISSSRTSVTSCQHPKLAAELRQLERDLFHVGGDRTRKSVERKATDELETSRDSESDKQPTDSPKTTPASTPSSLSPVVKAKNQIKTARPAVRQPKTPDTNNTVDTDVEPKPANSRVKYGTWQTENELKLTLKSLLSTIDQFRALHFAAPRSTAAEIGVQLNSLIAAYNQLKTEYNVCRQQRVVMGRKLRNTGAKDSTLAPVPIPDSNKTDHVMI